MLNCIKGLGTRIACYADIKAYSYIVSCSLYLKIGRFQLRGFYLFGVDADVAKFPPITTTSQKFVDLNTTEYDIVLKKKYNLGDDNFQMVNMHDSKYSVYSLAGKEGFWKVD